MPRTKGSKTLTKALFVKCRALQSIDTKPERITEQLGLSEAQQRRCVKIGTVREWDRQQGARAVQRRAKRTNQKLEVRRAVIERNTKRKAQRQAVADQVESNRVYALEERVQKLSHEVVTLRNKVADIEDDTEHRLERSIASIPDTTIGSLEDVYGVHPDFLLADAEHNRPRRKWFGLGGKR